MGVNIYCLLHHERSFIMQSDSLFNAVCDGCGEEQPPGVISSGGRPLCSVEMDHTTSDGGHATVEMLSIEYGWWRPTPTSRQVLPCYNEDACGGGTTGAPGYCNTGYKDECETEFAFTNHCWPLLALDVSSKTVLGTPSTGQVFQNNTSVLFSSSLGRETNLTHTTID